MICVTGVRFNMKATILNHYAPTEDGETVETAVVGGHWETLQDEDTGTIKRVWIEDTAVVPTSQQGTNYAVTVNRFDIDCMVRGFTDVGFRSSANTESFYDGVYKAFEVLTMTFPSKYVLNRRQLVTNIRGRNNIILWLEEETGNPTVFEVQGTTPGFDPFGRHIDNLAVIKRSAIQ